jgi:hypothetical protein
MESYPLMQAQCNAVVPSYSDIEDLRLLRWENIAQCDLLCLASAQHPVDLCRSNASKATPRYADDHELPLLSTQLNCTKWRIDWMSSSIYGKNE